MCRLLQPTNKGFHQIRLPGVAGGPVGRLGQGELVNEAAVSRVDRLQVQSNPAGGCIVDPQLPEACPCLVEALDRDNCLALPCLSQLQCLKQQTLREAHEINSNA